MERASVSERAQATVEAAVVLPVLIVLALISFNLMRFAVAVSRFDRMVPNVVVALGVAPSGDGTGAQEAPAAQAVADEVERVMEGYDVSVAVETRQSSGASPEGLSLVGELRTYTCRMEYAPWPSGLSIAGVSLGAPLKLVHEKSVTVDPWRPGVVV